MLHMLPTPRHSESVMTLITIVAAVRHDNSFCRSTESVKASSAFLFKCCEPRTQAWLKLKTIHKCVSSAPIKGRSQCYTSLRWHIYNAGKSLREEEFLLQLENKQQSIPNNVELTQQVFVVHW